MNATRRPARHQQKRIQSYRADSSSYQFFNLLTSDSLLDKVESLLPEHRERLYPPTQTLSMFLAQAMNADRSCQNSVNQAALERIAGGLSTCSSRTGAYCRARQRLPLNLVSELVQHTGALIDDQTPQQWRWKGRPVRVVDGTTVTLPDTPENQQAYPQSKLQKPGLGFPICRIVGLTCLSSGALQDAAIGPIQGKGSDERALLRSLQDRLKPGDILLGDALYATYFFIAQMQARGVDIVMEQHGSRTRVTDFRRGVRLGLKDHLIVLSKPKYKPQWMSEEAYRYAPESLTVREVRVGGKLLITTLACPKAVHKNELKALYRQRWSIELDFRDIKTTMGMETLSCKTPKMAMKEIWVYLLAYNLIRLLMAQAAHIAHRTPREISFKHSLQLWLLWSQQGVVFDDQMLYHFCLLIAEQRVGNRPGRIEPRAVKRRPKPYRLLTQLRQEERENIRKNGHPKKLK